VDTISATYVGHARSRKYKGGLPRIPGGGGVDYREDFFGKPAYLTVSGQLQVTHVPRHMVL